MPRITKLFFAFLLVMAPVFQPVAAHADQQDPLGTVYAAAQNHGLTAWETHEMVETVRCETGGTFSPYAKGDGEKSVGLAQIHVNGEYKNFLAMGYTDRENAEEAADFMAIKFKRGEKKPWSCWRLHFG